MPGDVLQRKGIRVLSRLSQKSVAQSVKPNIRVDPNLITGKLFPGTPHFRFDYPGLDFLVGLAWRHLDEVFEDCLRFFVDFENAFADPPLY